MALIQNVHSQIYSENFECNVIVNLCVSKGERVGAFSVMCDSKEVKDAVESQVKILIRPLYSNPPIHGARLANEVLNDKELYNEWLVEVKEMADRVIDMRQQLKENLANEGRYIVKVYPEDFFWLLNPDCANNYF